jgi:hypothetical protein
MRRLTLALTGALLLGLILPNTVFAGRPGLCLYHMTPSGQTYCKPVIAR